MSTNHFGIYPVVKDKKLQFIDLQTPSVPGVTIRLDRALIVEMRDMLTQLLDAERDGTIDQLTGG